VERTQPIEVLRQPKAGMSHCPGIALACLSLRRDPSVKLREDSAAHRRESDRTTASLCNEGLRQVAQLPVRGCFGGSLGFDDEASLPPYLPHPPPKLSLIHRVHTHSSCPPSLLCCLPLCCLLHHDLPLLSPCPLDPVLPHCSPPSLLSPPFPPPRPHFTSLPLQPSPHPRSRPMGRANVPRRASSFYRLSPQALRRSIRLLHPATLLAPHLQLDQRSRHRHESPLPLQLHRR
jgi:hypothetical protein